MLVGAVGALVPIAGGILAYLIKIERSLAGMSATVKGQGYAIDDLQSWRLNAEHAKALTVIRRFSRDIP